MYKKGFVAVTKNLIGAGYCQARDEKGMLLENCSNCYELPVASDCLMKQQMKEGCVWIKN